MNQFTDKYLAALHCTNEIRRDHFTSQAYQKKQLRISKTSLGKIVCFNYLVDCGSKYSA